MNRVLQFLVLCAAFGASAWGGFALTAPPEAEARPESRRPAPARPGPAPESGGTGAPEAPATPERDPRFGGPLGDLDGEDAPPLPPPADGEPIRMTFNDLSQWDLDPRNVQVPRSILALGGRRLDVVGYMIPYGDPDEIEEFVLVRDLGSCCFGQAPLPHHVIECRMVGGKRVSYVPGPVRVRGVFHVEEHRQGRYLISVYSMDVEDCTEVR